jgi:hypothetical protein
MKTLLTSSRLISPIYGHCAGNYHHNTEDNHSDHAVTVYHGKDTVALINKTSLKFETVNH